MIADGSTLDCGTRLPNRLESTGLVVDLQSVLEFKPNELLKRCDEGVIDKLRCWFDQCLGVFLRQICGRDTFRPLPPMLGDGQCVDLFKLFLVVREKGGCNAVSEKRLWDSVTEESGLGSSLTVAVKLVYIKYLDTLERWLGRVTVKDPKRSLSSSLSNLDKYLMELQSEFKGFLSEIEADGKANDVGLYPHLGLSCDLNFEDDDHNDVKRAVVVEAEGDQNLYGDEENENSDFGKKVVDVEKLCVDDEGFCFSDSTKSMKKEPDIEKLLNICEVKREESDGGRRCNDGDDIMILDPGTVKEENFGHKRKRNSLWGMLDWVTMVAKDPGDPAIGLLPDKSKWKSYANVELWKQVLLAREAIFSKRNIDSGAEQSWQVCVRKWYSILV